MARDLPIFPLALVLVPGERLPLHIFEPRYRELLDRCLDDGEPFVLVLEDDDGMRDVGCTAVVAEADVERLPDGRSNIVAVGGEPVRLRETHDEHAYRSALVDALEDEPDAADEALQAAALAAFAGVADELAGEQPALPEPGPGLAYALAGLLELPLAAKQALLEDRSETSRLRAVTELLEGALRGLVLTRETQARARRNGRVRTAEELAAELGLE